MIEFRKVFLRFFLFENFATHQSILFFAFLACFVFTHGGEGDDLNFFK